MHLAQSGQRVALAKYFMAAALVLLTAAMLFGSTAIGAKATEPGVDGGPDAPEVWCPCTGRYVPRVQDCPDCDIDGMRIDVNPRLVTVKRDSVAGNLTVRPGQTTDELRISFEWDTGDVFTASGGYSIAVELVDGSRARWQQTPGQMRGRLTGRVQGNTQIRIRLMEAATNRAVYTSPLIPVVVTPRPLK
jgi:hypothetical protein